jgi:hypothetical protein
MSEPTIVINGCRLTDSQSMAVRMAVSDLYAGICQNPCTMGKDELGQSFAATCKERSQEVLVLMGRSI